MSLGLWQDRAPAEVLRTARVADELGYGEIWIGEMATFDAFALGAVVAERTARADITVGPLAVAVRDPVMIAMGAGSLAELTGRTVKVALGSSSPVVVEQWHGRRQERTATALAESATAVRALLAGGKADVPGEVISTRGFRLRTRAPGTPLTIAAFGRGAVKVAARHADRMVINLVTPKSAACLVQMLHEECRAAGRPVPPVAEWLATVVDPSAATDQLADGESYPIPRIIDAYAEQMGFVQSAGAGVIVMASRALAASARGAHDYLEVYGELLRQAERPVILHWLGEAFDPALRGYWGSSEFGAAADTVIELISRFGEKVDGVKLSVLDAGREVTLRRRLPDGVRLYTGDDFSYAELIRGDAAGHSDALLGAFAAITAPAAAALAALDRGDLAGYDAAMAPTVPLSRAIFEPPTYDYKVGVAFLAWLNGFQPRFAMLGGLQRRRPARHLLRMFELAAAAGALTDPELAVERLNGLVAPFAGPGRA